MNKKTLILLLPFLVWIVFFTIFEPIDYWGIKGFSYEDFDSTDPLARMRLWKHSKSKKLILGDSRIAGAYKKFQWYETVSGEDVDWEILGFAGASLDSNIKLFWYAVDQREIDSVIIQISFWMVGKHQSKITPYFQYEKNPFSFYLSRNYNLDALRNFSKIFAADKEIESEAPEVTDYTEIRLEEARYIREVLCDDFDINYDIMNQLYEIADYCEQKGIECVFVIPPEHRVIWEYVIDELELNDRLDEYKAKLSWHAPVIDMEYKSELIDSEAFTDGVHFVGNLYEEWLGTCFRNRAYMKHCRIWEKGKLHELNQEGQDKQ